MATESIDRHDEVRVMDALRRIVRALRGSHGRSRSASGLSTSRLFVLRQIATSRALTMPQLAAKTGTSETIVSEVVARLIGDGLALRAPSAEDPRRFELVLTHEGQRVVQRSARTVQEQLLLSFERLTPSEQRALADALESWVAGAGLSSVSPAMFFERNRDG